MHMRKFFHLIVSLVCIVGLLYDIQLTYLASVAVSCAFIVVGRGGACAHSFCASTECVRVLRAPPALGDALDVAVRPFLDAQDSASTVVTTHIYLLCGTFLPLWINV
jgi:hypothetical protein